tara:strand:+ start:10695 stop:10910 length:216 start_codon:yes stop_codon:yes gene_type:complete
MLSNKKFSGLIRQSTIDGFLSFISGNEYKVSKTDIDYTYNVGGVYEVHETGEHLRITLSFHENELNKHINV